MGQYAIVILRLQVYDVYLLVVEAPDGGEERAAYQASDRGVECIVSRVWWTCFHLEYGAD